MLKKVWTIAEKDILMYYLKGPVIIFGVLFPFFLFFAFYIGRNLPLSFLLSGLVSMTLFFTSTAVSPVIAPWETQMKTLERLISCPVSIKTIIMGDIFASFIFGVIISSVPILFSICIGINIYHPVLLFFGLIISTFCFSSLGILFSFPPTSLPSNIMMFSNLIKFPLIFMSGIFIPIGELSETGRYFSFISPLTYSTDIVRYSFGERAYFSPFFNLFTLLVFSFLFLFLAIYLHEKNLEKRFLR
jgi:ABC-2 type transport system permease protein